MTAYTADAAYAARMDAVLGELSPGMYADLVVLSDDIFAIDPSAIADAKVDLTIVEGVVVYRRTI